MSQFRRNSLKLQRLINNGKNIRKQLLLRIRLKKLKQRVQPLLVALCRKSVAISFAASLAIFLPQAAKSQDFVLQQGAANPFNGVDVGYFSSPAFVNIDNDGDFDAFIGEQFGHVIHYKNTGTATSPVMVYQYGSLNPFNGIDVGYNSMVTFVNIDGDGDMDAFVGNQNGTISFYRNTGTATSPVFISMTGSNNPLNGVTVGQYSAPVFVDIDGDGDSDLFIGSLLGDITYYKNTGTAATPVFTKQTGAANPFNNVCVGELSAPAFVDLDGDDDVDAFIGALSGEINYYQNTGTPSLPVFSPQSGLMNPLNGVNVGGYSTPVFVDIDSDGDQDVFIGEIYGSLVYYKNMQPPCYNPVNGGSIAASQEICAGNIPAPFTSLSPATGQTGAPEYKWQFSNSGLSNSYTDIGASNSEAYAAGSLSVGTWYRRLARAACKNSWSGAASSNILQVSVDPYLTPSVNITASANPSEAGTPVTFTATPINGGGMPFYQWEVNGVSEGANNSTFSWIPQNGDYISCSMLSGISCPLVNPVPSNSIQMAVFPVPLNSVVQNTIISGRECHHAIQTLAVAGGQTFFTILSGGYEQMIAGTSIFFYPGTVVEYGGYLSGEINPLGPWCAILSDNDSISGYVNIVENKDIYPILVYPNPTEGAFFLEFEEMDATEPVGVEIIGPMGQTIIRTIIDDRKKNAFSLRGQPAGIYLVNIRSSGKQTAKKLILK